MRAPARESRPAEDRRNYCTRCNGIGIVSGWWLVWKRRRSDGPPEKRSREAGSYDVGLEMLKELGADDFDAELIEAGGPCSCRKPKVEPVAVDQKMAAAGERGD